jgi:hypothetical protein
MRRSSKRLEGEACMSGRPTARLHTHLMSPCWSEVIELVIAGLKRLHERGRGERNDQGWCCPEHARRARRVA